MNLYFKLLFLLFKRFFKRTSQGLTDLCISKFRVGLLDLDLNFHMNNGRYFSVMDLGRFDMMIRTGHFTHLFRAGYYPVVLSESMIFKKSLALFNKYEIHTRIESWDKDFFYLTQKFIKNEKIVSSGHVRACFKKRGLKGIVPTAEIFEFIGEKHSQENMTELSIKQKEFDGILLPRSK